MCMYVCMLYIIYEYVGVSMHACMCFGVCIYMFIFMGIHVCIHMCICVCVYICLCMRGLCVCDVHVCMYVGLKLQLQVPPEYM